MLMWQGPVILATPEAIQQRLLMIEIPQLREWIQTCKPIHTADRFPALDFDGLLLTTPEAWLGDRLHNIGNFPDSIPTILDGMDDLEDWTRSQLTVCIQPGDWNALMLAYPQYIEAIRDIRVQLTRTIFQRPANPYECYLIESSEQELLTQLLQILQEPEALQTSNFKLFPGGTLREQTSKFLPRVWQQFWTAFQQDNQLFWTEISRSHGQFSLHCAPLEMASVLSQIWSRQPIVLIGAALAPDTDAATYRQRVGLGDDLTCLKFSPDRQEEVIHLYLPDRLPMPNTPQFQAALLQEMHTLLRVSAGLQGLTVLLVDDMPLKAQVASFLASEFGSRVQLERTCLDDNGILVTGWQFWRQHQRVLPAPHLLAIATLPIPSLENPLIAGRVAHYKHLRQDWFRLFLLPEALGELQRAIAPARERQGVVALFDSRVLHRSYGQQVFAALNPFVRTSYLEASLFNQFDTLSWTDPEV
jgi:ATP-dependent DNA helicase DinG